MTYFWLKLLPIFVKACKKEQELCIPGLNQCCEGLMCDGLIGRGVCVKEAGKAFGLKSKYSFYQKFETQETSFLQTANILTYL